MPDKKIRVRFAPSPTGPLHMGGVRTALFNYLFAKQNGGDFILRIEDTDSHRFVPGAEDYIIEALKWCGIQIDEGVSVGGPHAPYRQSERRDIYIQYVEQLIEENKAYYAFDSAETLACIREEMKEVGKTFIYNHSTRKTLDNSLKMTSSELQNKLASEDQYVVRLLIEPDQIIECNDIVRGKVIVNSSTLDDKVLWKSADQLPTYHLANIVDDHLMEISHVIRGEEWLPSMPLHVLLYKAFGWESPEFAHLSLILKPDGKGKLSKRDGIAGGFPVFPLEWKDPKSDETYTGYKEDGYLPQAFINTISLLGWNPGGNEEIFSMDELIKKFDLKRVIKAGARFNPAKTKWFNSKWIKQINSDDIIQYIPEVKTELLIEYYKSILGDADLSKLAHTIHKIKNKAISLNDIPELVIKSVSPDDFINYNLEDYSKDEIQLAGTIMNSVLEMEIEECNQFIYDTCKDSSSDFKKITTLLRFSMTGVKEGLSIGDIIFINKKVLIDRLPEFNKMFS